MSRSIDAIELLQRDHEALVGVLAELAATTPRALKRRQVLLVRAGLELRNHTRLEEDLFYPALHATGPKRDQERVWAAYEVHRAIEQLVLPDLEKTDPSTVQFAGRVKVLRDLVAHHVEEEEQALFAEAQRILGQAELLALGEEMRARKAELMEEHALP